MSAWVWIPLLIAGIFVLLLFLLRVRYRIDWTPGSEWSAAVEFGIPGFRLRWKFPASSPAEMPAEAETPSPARETKEQGAPEAKRPPARGTRGSRMKRTFFLFLTDKAVLRGMLRYAKRFAGLLLGLLHLEFKGRLSLSNPATLGRVAGYWYAIKPFLGKRRLNLEFDFEQPQFSTTLSANGGFSLAQAIACLLLIFFSFPWILIARAAWRSWKLSQQADISGWRGWLYGRLVTAPRAGGIS